MVISDEDISLFNPNKRRFQTAPEDILKNLQLLSRLKGNQPVSREEYKRWPQKIVSPDVIYRMFGSWEKACQQAEIPQPPQKHKYSDQELVEHLHKVWQYFRQRPSIGNLKTYNARFGTSVTHDAYVRRWGSYTAFCTKFASYKLAGITFVELVKRPKRPARTAISARMRAQILARDNYTCQDCGASPRLSPLVNLQVHHLLPYSKGGMTIESNLITNCNTCNQGKSDVIVNNELFE